MIEIFYFDGKVKRGKLDELPKLQHHPLWIDVTRITKREAEILRLSFDLHPLTAEDILNISTRIKVEEFPNYLFCVFYGVEHRERHKRAELVEVDYVLSHKFLLTSHLADIPLFSELKNNPEQLAVLFRKGTDFVFHRLLDAQVDSYFPALEEIDEHLDAMEVDVTAHPPKGLLGSILEIRRLTVLLKKAAFPQREKIATLAKAGSRFIAKKAMPYFRDVHDHAVRIAESVDNYREAIANLFESYMLAVNNSTNEVTKALSIIATIALPLTAISSIYGMNFATLPGAGHVWGFWVMIAFMVAVCASMLYFFRKRGWL